MKARIRERDGVYRVETWVDLKTAWIAYQVSGVLVLPWCWRDEGCYYSLFEARLELKKLLEGRELQIDDYNERLAERKRQKTLKWVTVMDEGGVDAN